MDHEHDYDYSGTLLTGYSCLWWLTGCLVYGAVSVCRSGYSAGTRCDARRRWRRHQVLSDSELHSPARLRRNL